MARTLSEKLGLKPGMTGRVVAMPPEMKGLLETPAAPPRGASGPFHLVFVTSITDVEKAAKKLNIYQRGDILWIAYRKGGGAAGLTRDNGWDCVMQLGFLPVSQIAIDTAWSALRFRLRDEIKSLTRQSPWPGKPATNANELRKTS